MDTKPSKRPLLSRRLLLAAGVIGTLLLYFVLSESRPSSSAPSLKSRLALSERLWESSVVQRHNLVDQYGPNPPAWPSSNPLPYYTLWSFFPATFSCPWEVRRVGTIMDGGRWTCGLSRLEKASDCIVYSFDKSIVSGPCFEVLTRPARSRQLGESSFEAEILRDTKCRVYGYDTASSSFGPEITQVLKYRRRATFFPYTLGAKDNHVATPSVWTLRQLMKAHGHKFVDILRMDVEGGEWDLLSGILNEYEGEPLPFGQLQVELHAMGKSVTWMVEWWEKLEAAGLRPFMTEPNLVFANMAKHDPPALSEYSFINVLGSHKLLA